MPRLRAVPRVVRDERNRAGSRVDFRFGNEFGPGTVSPVTEENGREWSLAGWNNQIRCDRTALGTCVGNVMKGATVELLDDLVVDVERLLLVVVEEMSCERIHRRFTRCLCCLGNSDG